MFGLLVGLAIGLFGFLSGGPLQALQWASLFWLCWYGVWRSISGIFSTIVALGLGGGGMAAGGLFGRSVGGGILGSILGGLAGGSIGPRIMISWAVITALVVGGAYLQFLAGSGVATWEEVNLTNAVVGFVLMFIGAVFGGGSSSSSSSSDD